MSIRSIISSRSSISHLTEDSNNENCKLFCLYDIILIIVIADLSGVVAGSSTNQQTYSIDYLSQLLKDKKQLAAFPNVFHHLERLADEGTVFDNFNSWLESYIFSRCYKTTFSAKFLRTIVSEISRVRVALFQFEFTKKEDLQLPEAEGEAQVITEKVFVPAKEHPDVSYTLVYDEIKISAWNHLLYAVKMIVLFSKDSILKMNICSTTSLVESLARVEWLRNNSSKKQAAR